MTRQTVVQVDAFTDRPFRGNPAAVCLLAERLDDSLMQAIAAEMNLSETAFLTRGEADGDWGLRWFTPTMEVDLCGHATLASAHVLWEDGHAARSATVHFHTRSGSVSATRRRDWIELDFPALPGEPETPSGWLAAALGAVPVRVERSRFDYLVELESEAAVRGLQPDFARLGAEPVRGFIVTARGDGEFDFVSRYFCPAVGIAEDPVTGSAHSALAPFWAPRLGKKVMTGYQASRRGGVVRVTLAGDRVFLGGQAITTLRGELIF